MQLATTTIRTRFRRASRSVRLGRFIGYGVAVLVPALGLIGAARADAPAPAGGFVPIEISADIDARMAQPAAAAIAVDAVLDAASDTPGLAAPAEDMLAQDILAEDMLENIAGGGASYYGPNLAGNRTASGERFDPTQLTAAHRTLPMGSKVKVTMGGKSVIVRINDRGPFHGNRVIDLSTAAAKQIGLFRAGTGRVKLQLVSG